jgi:beta-glucanase (GH16 family)
MGINRDAPIRGGAFAVALMLALTTYGPDLMAKEVQAAPAGKLVERFESLNQSIWMVSNGWSNGAWTANDWRADHVGSGPGGLVMSLTTARGGDKPYSGGEIQSRARYHYGYFETEARFPRGSGIVSSVFTYAGDPHDEIDIEVIGRKTDEIMLTVYTDGERHSKVVPLGFDAAADYHLYAFEWMSDRIRWYVDGKVVNEVHSSDFALPQTPQIFMVNLWNSSTQTDWVGPIDDKSAPWTLHIRCMAYAPSYADRALCQ